MAIAIAQVQVMVVVVTIVMIVGFASITMCFSSAWYCLCVTCVLVSRVTCSCIVRVSARVLREDGRKSVDLCINIVSVVFARSNFSQFHELVIEHHIGDLTMCVIDLELKRTESRSSDEAMKVGGLQVLPGATHTS